MVPHFGSDWGIRKGQINREMCCFSVFQRCPLLAVTLWSPFYSLKGLQPTELCGNMFSGNTTCVCLLQKADACKSFLENKGLSWSIEVSAAPSCASAVSLERDLVFFFLICMFNRNLEFRYLKKIVCSCFCLILSGAFVECQSVYPLGVR